MGNSGTVTYRGKAYAADAYGRPILPMADKLEMLADQIRQHNDIMAIHELVDLLAHFGQRHRPPLTVEEVTHLYSGGITPLAEGHEVERRCVVGIGSVILKDGCVLVGERGDCFGTGEITFPGGHQNFGESWSRTAEREGYEETGMQVQSRYFDRDRLQPYLCVTDDYMATEQRHYTTVYVVCDWLEGEPVAKEPDKCKSWRWATLGELKQLPINRGHRWVPLAELELHRTQLGLKD